MKTSPSMGVVGVGLLCLLASCNPCGEEVKSEVESIDGAFVARYAIRDCGATTAESAVVVLENKGWPINRSAVVFGTEQSWSQIQLEWADTGHLVIRHTASEFIQHMTQYRGVRIEVRSEE